MATQEKINLPGHWLVLIPVKKNLKDALRQKMKECALALKNYAEEHVTIIFDDRGEGDANASTKIIGLFGRLQKLAEIRNACIKEYVDPQKYNFVVMCDADVWYPEDIIYKLYQSSVKIGNPEKIIIAPGVYMEGYGNTRFYDTSGFITKLGEKARFTPPFFKDNILGVREMASVGTFYVMPSWICKEIQYCGSPGPTDHFAVCQQAMSFGVKTYCDFNIVVSHANLPRYGEEWH